MCITNNSTIQESSGLFPAYKGRLRRSVPRIFALPGVIHNFFAKLAVLAIVISFVFVIIVPVPVLASEGFTVIAADEISGSQGDIDSETDLLGSGLSTFTDTLEMIHRLYVDDADMAKVYEGALRGAVRSLGDPYSVYLDPEQLKDFTEDTIEGEFGGIGVVIDMVDGYVTVIAPLSGTPAYYSDIKPGDKIIEVNGIDVRNKITDDVADMIRGEPGTQVSLTLLRADRLINVDLTRAIIHIETVSKNMIEGTALGYIKITQFTKGTSSAFIEALDILKALDAKGIVLDLRDNPGGLLDEALWIANEVVPEGPMLTILKKGGHKVILESTLEGKPLPMAVLVNGGSASASEILAGAIRDRGVGFLVGTRTFGKGSVQSVVRLKDGGALKITTARYLTPSGEEVSLNGLEPNIEVTTRANTPVVPEDVRLARDIKRGTVGLDVLAIQEALKWLGYDPGTLDGIHGEKSSGALRRFQADNDINISGLPNGDTIKAINAALVKAKKEAASVDLQLEAAVKELNKRLGESAQ